MEVKCPRCGKETIYSPDNPYRPFCSKRCKDSDLYGWLTDKEDDEPEIADEDLDDSDDFLPGTSRGTKH
jgi:endogenous inhibitor of DNA gyrase (YacG/DUF329 family)